MSQHSKATHCWFRNYFLLAFLVNDSTFYHLSSLPFIFFLLFLWETFVSMLLLLYFYPLIFVMFKRKCLSELIVALGKDGS